ncbi:MAG TPA: 3-hydroxyacyl-CoA dehydrogenase family protein [Deltaproteobacteria bacterium]|jgi:3-hydroxybutyryl-CoA dehydrogenase|nr:3-hydroxyacyl-CoA dehydrogenase family protein [Deltaproteobacteria bacterium]
MSDVRKVGVVGAGMMGAEIALCFAASGFDVVIHETSLDLAKKGKERLGGILDKSIQKGKATPEEKTRFLESIALTDDFEGFEDADVVVEAVFEDFGTKKEVFSRLDTICKPQCIFATNTSSLPITLLATAVGPDRTGKFLGAHFFSPAFVMKLVEVIPALDTDEDSVAFMMDCCRKINKIPVRVKDVAGFAVNRLLHAMWVEACRLLEEGVATPEDIDNACRYGLGHPIGPFALMDLTSNDLNLKVQQILFDAYGERFRPRPVLKQLVDANHLGRKTGRGWHRYNK